MKATDLSQDSAPRDTGNSWLPREGESAPKELSNPKRSSTKCTQQEVCVCVHMSKKIMNLRLSEKETSRLKMAERVRNNANRILMDEILKNLK